MILPENGSVVIIDDQPQEAIPLIQALSKRGISATYYKGYKKEDLPDTGVQSVRLVILDLQLFAGVTDPRTISTNLVKILQHVLGASNGPYVLLLWSQKESMYSTDFVEEVNKTENKIIPALIVSLPKNQCLTQEKSDTSGLADDLLKEIGRNLEDGTDLEALRRSMVSILSSNQGTVFTAKPNAVEIIEKAIDTELKKAGVFHLFVIWENLIKKSSAKIVADVFNLVQFNERWELNARDIFRRMGVARVGLNNVENSILIKESISTLNNSFIDSLELELKNSTIPEYIDISSNTLLVIKRDNSMFSLIKESDGEYSIYKDESRLAKDKSKEGVLKSTQTNKKISDTDKKFCAELILIYDRIPNTLNTKLHIELSPSQELIPGNVYIINSVNDVKKRQYLGTYFKKIEENIDRFFLIELEVSPICDYAQSKWSRSRVLPGIIYPYEFADNLKSKNGGVGYFYDVEPVFDIDGALYKIRFDHRLFNALDKSHHDSRTVKYRLKREVLMDIIAQLSSHVHRPGISFVS